MVFLLNPLQLMSEFPYSFSKPYWNLIKYVSNLIARITIFIHTQRAHSSLYT